MIKLTYTKILPLVAAAVCLSVAACEKTTETTTTTTETEMAPPADTGTAMSDMGMSDSTMVSSSMTSTTTSM